MEQEYVKIRATNPDGATANITRLCRSITWSGDWRSAARTLRYSPAACAGDTHLPRAPTELGGSVQLWHGADLLMAAYALERTRDSLGHTIDVTAYDGGIYLTRNSAFLRVQESLRRKGILTRDGSVITGEILPNLQSLDVVGRYRVAINGKTYDTVCVMDIECFDDAVASEQFVDQNGRTVLWRRFNREDWAIDRYGKPWTQLLPDNERILVNGQTYVHWYDCITDYIL